MADALEAIAEQVYTPDPRPLPATIALAPSSFIFTGEDALRLTVYNSVTGVIVAVHSRQHAPDGGITASADRFTPSSDRMPAAAEFVIGRGALLNVSLFVVAGTPLLGQTFAKLQVVRGRGAAAIVLGTIVQGYLTANQDLAWPGSQIRNSSDVLPAIRTVIGTNPAAGVEIAETVPAGARWEIVSVHCRFSTNATPANRQPSIYFTSGGVTWLYLPHQGIATAGAVWEFMWVDGYPYAAVLNPGLPLSYLPPRMPLASGTVIATATTGLQAGDNYDSPRIQVRESMEAQ